MRATQRTDFGALIDIIVVTYNSSALLADCLRPFAEDSRFHLIVCDNGSNDESEEFARSFGARTMSFPENPGFAVACNAGALGGTSEYLLFMNPDVRASPETVLDVARAMDEADAAIAGCRLVQQSGEIDHACKRMVVRPLEAAKFVLLGKKQNSHYAAPQISEHDQGWVDAINGAFMLVRREVFQEIGGFNENFWMYMEDIELSVRAASLGHRTLYYGKSTAVHLKSAVTGRARSPRLNYHFYRSAWIFYRDNQSAEDALPVRAATWLSIYGWCLIAVGRDSARRAAGRGLPFTDNSTA